MLAKVLSSAIIGIEAVVVEVEVDINSGLPAFTTVGLPEAAVKESRERVKSAIGNSGYRFPDDRITVNLAPADIKKEGTGFDLPMALGILTATRLIPVPDWNATDPQIPKSVWWLADAPFAGFRVLCEPFEEGEEPLGEPEPKDAEEDPPAEGGGE